MLCSTPEKSTGLKNIRLATPALTASFSWDDGSVRVAVTDLRTGQRLVSGLAEVESMWDALQRIDPVEPARLLDVCQVDDTRAVFTLSSGRSRIEWEMEVSLEDAEIRVRIPWASVTEHRVTQMRLMGIRPLPGLLSTKDTLLLPLRSGGLVHVAAHAAPANYRTLIYGEQQRWEELPMLPVCGIFRQDEFGVGVLATDGECDAQYEIELDGKGLGSCGFSLRYRHSWPDPVDPVDRAVVYHFFAGSEAGYPAIGRWLRDYMREHQGVRTLEEKARQTPEILAASRSLVIKTFHAMKELDREEGDGAYHAHQTFAETADQLARIKQAGIEHAYVQLVGWNIDGHDGQYPARFPVDERVGGEHGFRALVGQGQTLGYQMQVHDNYVDSTDPCHPGTIQRTWQTPVSRGVWGGGAIYALNPRKMPSGFVREELEKVRALGVKGIVYLDGIAPPLEVDHDPENGGPRRFHAEGLADLIDTARSLFGACGIESGFAHLARKADYVAHTWFRDRIQEKDVTFAPLLGLIDEWVPLWHIAFHGLVLHALRDNPFPTVNRLLEAAETGSLPRIDITGETPGDGPIFGTQWTDALIPSIKAKYEILSVTLGDNTLAFILDHRCLGGSAHETVFSNGNRVRVNYSEGRLWLNEKEIPIPPDYERVYDVRTS